MDLTRGKYSEPVVIVIAELCGFKYYVLSIRVLDKNGYPNISVHWKLIIDLIPSDPVVCDVTRFE